MAAKTARTNKRLPAALAARARAAAASKSSRARDRAEELCSLIARRKARIAEDFFDIGLALKELKQPALYTAIGCPNFTALLVKVGLSAAVAHELLRIVTEVPRALAVELGQSKSAALVALAAATPAADTAASLASSSLAVRGRHKPVDLRKASARDILRVAKEVRREHAATASGARDAARIAKEIERALEEAEIAPVRVRALRVRAKGEKERYALHVSVPLEARGVLATVLRKVR